MKVYILAGQSNMAKCAVSQGRWLNAHGGATGDGDDRFVLPWRKDGHWIERKNVWIKFLDRKGNLTVGFGSPGCIGPELGFGEVVGNHSHQQVLLIKTAWGGRSSKRFPLAEPPKPAVR